MSDQPAAAWPVLSPHERRILGVLVEKQKTTDTYPLSLNSLVTGCNQKSNRDPVLALDDADAEIALGEAQKKGLAVRVISGRVEKWRHNLYDAWQVSPVEMAVLAELLLRGPQTEGELRGRASRMEPVADVEALRAVLKPLTARKLVVYLTPEGRRGTVLTHGFHAPQELERLRQYHNSAAAQAAREAESAPPAQTPPPAATRPDAARAELDALRAEVADLRAALSRLVTQVERIRAELGLSPAPPPPG